MTELAAWEGHQRDSREYRRILVALACAGVATFAQLYSPQGILPEISTSLAVSPASSALLISAATSGWPRACCPGRGWPTGSGGCPPCGSRW